MNSLQTYNITEADVLLWLRERAAATGIDGLFIRIGTDNEISPVTIGVEDIPGSFGFGKTINDALEQAHLRGQLSRNFIAAQKREQAAKLLAEAEAILPRAVVEDKQRRAA